MKQDLIIYLYMLLLLVLVSFLTPHPPFLVALFAIDKTLSNGNSTKRNERRARAFPVSPADSLPISTPGTQLYLSNIQDWTIF